MLRLYTCPPLTGRDPVESTLPARQAPIHFTLQMYRGRHFGQRLQRDYSVAPPPPFPPVGASLLRCLPPTRLYHSLYVVGYKITQNPAAVKGDSAFARALSKAGNIRHPRRWYPQQQFLVALLPPCCPISQETTARECQAACRCVWQCILEFLDGAAPRCDGARRGSPRSHALYLHAPIGNHADAGVAADHAFSRYCTLENQSDARRGCQHQMNRLF